MADRPILFSGPMVRALLDGRKTQTRRAVKVRTGDLFDVRAFVAAVQERIPAHDPIAGVVGTTSRLIRCPYGVPGDRLWVRETFAHPNDQVTIYRADWREDAEARGLENIPATDGGIRWRPTIHMPRWASRLTLTITDVRVERLQDISETDAWDEGVRPIPSGEFAVEGIEDFPPFCETASQGYAALWEHINGKGSWAENPWCWAVSFRCIQANIDEVIG